MNIRLTGLVTLKPLKEDKGKGYETVKKIMSLTDKNQHTEAIIELAKDLGDRPALEILKGIEMIHNAEGSIPTDIQKYRDKVLNSLLEKAKKRFDKEYYEAIKKAF